MSRRAEKCPSGKLGSYVTLAAAQDDLVRVQRELRQRNPDAKVPERAYPCDVCDFWHLTSNPRARPGRARAGRAWRRR